MSKHATVAGAVLVMSLVSPVHAQDRSQPPRYDLIIKNGRVLDGSGNPWFYADIAVSGDRIASCREPRGAAETASHVIDATGLVVTPGFIDVHSHAAPQPR